MCTFLLKEVVRSYTTKNTPVYSVFLDASKAFDRVNHAMLFRKLMARSVGEMWDLWTIELISKTKNNRKSGFELKYFFKHGNIE